MRRSKNEIFNFINKKFGKLTIIRLLEFNEINKNGYWFECLCDCGKTTKVSIYKLETFHTRSCGCLNKEFVSQRQQAKLVGKIFGNLEVLSKNSVKNQSVVWECKCVCGKHVFVNTRNLNSKNTKSCGCISLQKGENHFNWNPNISNFDRLTRRGVVKNPLYIEWIEKVFSRDNYICQLTGKRGRLSAHHLNAWNKFPEQRFDVNNGITLLKKVHVFFHKIYGLGNNTKEQFKEFTNNYLTGIYDDRLENEYPS